MHMADALLAPAVAAVMYAASGTAAGVSIHRLKKDDNPQKLPTMAVTAALVFAGQMINYTIPGTDVRHRLVIIRKVKPTPTAFPRAFARIKKNPLI